LLWRTHELREHHRGELELAVLGQGFEGLAAILAVQDFPLVELDLDL